MDYIIIICLVFALIGVHPPNDVKVTVYHIRGLTASGEHTDRIKEPFIAVSRDLLEEYPMHTKVRLFDCPFEGDYIVKDKMNKRMKKMVDVFLPYTGKRYNPCYCKLQTMEEYNNPITEEVLNTVDSIGVTESIDTTQSGKNR
jgi:3D (Asp-Asp-Asp) domain-containing protein